MIYQLCVIFLLWESAFSYPQSIRIPEIKDGAPPEEINSLTEHKQYTRSIGKPPISHNNIEETIKEVEAMLKINPTLPRLTRGEIMDLIDNITKEDMANGKLASNNTDGRDPKAIMVVMPYTPSNSNPKNMEELYTKPPVTHIVGSEPFQLNANQDSSKAPKEESFNDVSYSFQNTKSTSTQISIISTTTSLPIPSKQRGKQRRRKPQPSTTEAPKSTPEPPVTTHRPGTRARRPLRRRPTTTEKHPNHRYPDEQNGETPKKINDGGIKIIQSPKFDPISEDLIMQEDQHSDYYAKHKLAGSTENQPKVVSTTESVSTITDLGNQDLKVPQLDQVSEGSGKDVPAKASPSEEEQLRQMLESLGMVPAVATTTTTTAVPDISNVADNLTPEMRELLKNFGLIPNLEQSGTQKSPRAEIDEGFNPVKAEVKPESYASFKPLPDDVSSRHEMDELLARFGLTESRKRKSLPKKTDGGDFDVVPDQYKGVLEDIGLTNREGKMIRAEALVKTEEKQHVFNPAESPYASDEEVKKLNQLLEFVKKLEKLNRTVTDEDVKEMDVDNIKELLDNLNQEKLVPLDEQRAPNPIHFDLGLDKNEVKRQKNSTVQSNPKAEVENITLAITAKVEDVTPNLKDLEASFGGQVDANPVTETPVVETTTSSPRNGFYYLLDWNTFLDIDDQKGKRVNLRFQPTAGDPKRFLSVSVP